MDHSAILAAVPGLAGRLERAGARDWLSRQRRVTVEGRDYYVLGGDRLASEAEAMLAFASERKLVSPQALQKAAAAQPLPEDVSTVEIETDKEGDA